MSKPLAAPALADRPLGDTVRLAEDVPVRGDGWLRDGDVVCITGALSGGWRLVRVWSESGWAEPIAVPATARIATAIPQRPDRRTT